MHTYRDTYIHNSLDVCGMHCHTTTTTTITRTHQASRHTKQVVTRAPRLLRTVAAAEHLSLCCHSPRTMLLFVAIVLPWRRTGYVLICTRECEVENDYLLGWWMHESRRTDRLAWCGTRPVSNEENLSTDNHHVTTTHSRSAKLGGVRRLCGERLCVWALATEVVSVSTQVPESPSAFAIVSTWWQQWTVGSSDKVFHSVQEKLAYVGRP